MFLSLSPSPFSYYIDGAANVFAVYVNCTPTSGSQTDDEKDNDCDELIDEEIENGEDDDGDGQNDEDVTAVSDYNCGSRQTVSNTWEPNRYVSTT